MKYLNKKFTHEFKQDENMICVVSLADDFVMLKCPNGPSINSAPHSTYE